MRWLLAALTVLVITSPADAQWLEWKTPGVPRSADGTPNLRAPAPRAADGKPDLTGVWNGPTIPARPDPANLQPWVLNLVNKRQQEYYKTRPFYQCRPSGPEVERFGGWKRILQTPAAIAILNDDLTYRMIFTDGRQLEDNAAPSWMGYSVGHWDGNTLVVESNGFNDKTWASRYGVAHTEALRTTERYTRRDFGHLDIEVTYTDPGAFKQPWGFKTTTELAADTEMIEQVCELTSDSWSNVTDGTVSVAPEILARYVGVYSGIYGGKKRTLQVTLAGNQLMMKIVGAVDEGGLGAVGLDPEALRPLLARSQTLFEGAGLGYEFVVNDKGAATDVVEIHISGPYKFAREK